MSLHTPFCRSYSPLRIVVPVDPGGGGGGGGGTGGTGKKKNKGIYLGMSGGTDTGWSVTGSNPGIVQRLAADTAGKLKGVQVRLDWTDLERAIGEYSWTEGGLPKGFALIDKLMNDIKTYKGNRLIIMLMIKQFNNVVCVPSYMRTIAYKDVSTTLADYYGCYHYKSVNNPKSGGYVISMHTPAVAERFKALLAAIAAKYDNNDQLEAIIFNEASINTPFDFTWPATERKKWFNNTRDAYIFAKTKFQRTNLLQFFNSDRKDMSEWINNDLIGWIPELVAAGIGLGMTDGCRNDLSFQFVPSGQGPAPNSNYPGNMWIIKRYKSLVPVIVNMSGPAQVGSIAAFAQTANSSAPGVPQYTFPGPAYTREENQRWAREDIGAHYVLWMASNNIYGPTYTVNNNTYTVANVPSDAASGDYTGKTFDKVTTNWINHQASNILTAADPAAWQ